MYKKRPVCISTKLNEETKPKFLPEKYACHSQGVPRCYQRQSQNLKRWECSSGQLVGWLVPSFNFCHAVGEKSFPLGPSKVQAPMFQAKRCFRLAVSVVTVLGKQVQHSTAIDATIAEETGTQMNTKTLLQIERS